jgi:hypothetical protein
MISEETLTLYFYEDGLSDKERAEVTKALKTDRVLAARYATLRGDLDTLSQFPESGAPGHLQHQWHALIASEAQLERQRQPAQKRPTPWFFAGAALASVLALGIAIGIFIQGGEVAPGTELAENPAPTGQMERQAQQGLAFTRGLQFYLEEQHDELISFDNRSDPDRVALLKDIIAQNRLFEHAAEQQEAPEIARLMRALEPVLLRLADAETTPEDAQALRRQLAFELNAMLTKLQTAPSKETETI